MSNTRIGYPFSVNTNVSIILRQDPRRIIWEEPLLNWEDPCWAKINMRFLFKTSSTRDEVNEMYSIELPLDIYRKFSLEEQLSNHFREICEEAPEETRNAWYDALYFEQGQNLICPMVSLIATGYCYRIWKSLSRRSCVI